MDPLFLMQRYLGSDDSDAEVDGSYIDKLGNVLKRVRDKKVQKSEYTNDLFTENLTGNIQGDLNSDSHVLRKKRKKLKRSSEEIKKYDNDETVNNDLNSETAETTKSFSGKKRKVTYENSLQEYVKDIKINKKRKLAASSRNNINDNLVDEKENSGTECDANSVPVHQLNGELEDDKDTETFSQIKNIAKKKNEKVVRIPPDWLANPTFIKSDVQCEERPVEELDFLDECTKQNLKKCGIGYLFPVQTEVIPWLMQSSLKRYLIRPSDICVSAPTGSGKTLAFVIPIIQSLKNRVVRKIRAVVVLPVGDLAFQVFKVFESFRIGTDLRICLATGQKSFQEEQAQLVKECMRGVLIQSDIVVCTPGRLLDHINRTQGFSLEDLQYLVIDEADRMMEEIQQGWLKKVEAAVFQDKKCFKCSCFDVMCQFKKLQVGPSSACGFGHVSEPMQKLLYSATLSQDPEKLHELLLYRPKLFTSVSEKDGQTASPKGDESVVAGEFIGKYTTPKGLKEYYVECDSSIKPIIICYLIKKFEFQRVLCFTQSLEHSHRLHLVLSDMLEFKIRELSSNLRAVQRKIILQQFASGKVDILVCSDMMARGMDIDNVDCVISYDAPNFMTKYVHRIGRTARAGKGGIAITLLEKTEVPRFRKMLTSGGKRPPVRMDVLPNELIDLEEKFRNALAKASDTIANEKHDYSLLKKNSRVSIRTRKGVIPR